MDTVRVLPNVIQKRQLLIRNCYGWSCSGVRRIYSMTRAGLLREVGYLEDRSLVLLMISYWYTD